MISLLDRTEELVQVVSASSVADFNFEQFEARYQAYIEAFDNYQEFIAKQKPDPGSVTAPHVCIDASRVSVEYLEGHAITSLEVDPTWREQLDRWLAEFGIEPPQDEPQWWMVSDYG